MSLDVKIEKYLLPPSKISALQVLPVASFIFGRLFEGINDFRSHISVEETASYKKVQLKKSHDVPSTMKSVLTHYESTEHIGLEESAGYTVLGIFMVFFAQALSKEVETRYKVRKQPVVAVNSNRGQNPSSDFALISLTIPLVVPSTSTACLLQGSRWITKVIYEYKPQIACNLRVVQPKALIEVFMQAYYTMKSEKLKTLLACLTDLQTWHYFKLKLSNGKLEGLSSSTLIMHLLPLPEQSTETEPSETQNTALLDHLLFLVHSLS